MKKLLLTMLGVLMSLPAIARNFTYTYEGQTIKYSVLDKDAKTVEIVGSSDGKIWKPATEVSGDLVLPSKVYDVDTEYTLIGIGYHAFASCSGLTSVVIPNSVTTIGDYAFEGCSGMTSVVIPNSVTKIDNYAFDGCSGLTSVVIPNSVTSIGGMAFHNCSGLTSVVIPNSVTFINYCAFEGCSGLTSVIIPPSVTSIGVRLFIGCNIVKAAYPPTLPDYVFQDISIKYKYEYDPTVTRVIDNCVYSRDKADLFFVPADVTSFEIPETVVNVGEFSFSGCKNLKDIHFGKSIEKIEEGAFSDCNSINRVYCNGANPAEAPVDLFTVEIYENATLYVPVGNEETYKKTRPWSFFDNVIPFNPNVPGEDGINAIDSESKVEVYSLSGLKIADSLENLPRGIYIVRKDGKTTKIVL